VEPAASNGKLMTEKQILSFKPGPRLTNIPSACRIANIALNDAMILSYDANLGRMEFSERTHDAFSGDRSYMGAYRLCFDKIHVYRRFEKCQRIANRNRGATRCWTLAQ
jgi:hypothetical protein